MLCTWGAGAAKWVLPGASVDLDFADTAYFPSPVDSAITTTRAFTGYAQTSSGLWVPFASNAPRITNNGLLIEELRQAIQLWARDLTNAAWVKSNITATLDQIGADGVVNSATRLTATSSNGTCLQSITSASAARTFSPLVKRITGSGGVYISQDGGSSYTDITASLSLTGFYRPSLTQTVTNPQIGFKLGTSGDEITVDFTQLEAGTFATSPIPTTTVAVTRAADNIVLKGAALAAFATYPITIMAQIGPVAVPNTNRVIGINNGAITPLFVNSASQIGSYEGSAQIVATLGSGSTAVKTGIVTSLTASGRTIIGNNGTEVSDTNPFAATTSVQVGSQGGSSTFLNTYLKRLTVWPSQLSASQRAALSVAT